jgi:hypothetical protein
MKLTYTYELLNKDDNARCATFLFKSEGLPEHLVSVRYPFEEEEFDAVIQQHAPVYAWSLLQKKVKGFPDSFAGTVEYEEECHCKNCEEKRKEREAALALQEMSEP